jgi:hypothetical protein
MSRSLRNLNNGTLIVITYLLFHSISLLGSFGQVFLFGQEFPFAQILSSIWPGSSVWPVFPFCPGCTLILSKYKFFNTFLILFNTARSLINWIPRSRQQIPASRERILDQRSTKGSQAGRDGRHNDRRACLQSRNLPSKDHLGREWEGKETIAISVQQSPATSATHVANTRPPLLGGSPLQEQLEWTVAKAKRASTNPTPAPPDTSKRSGEAKPDS